VRLGWDVPGGGDTLALFHGPLMVGGFLGTLIALERAAALGLVWAYAAPLATGLGSLLLVLRGDGGAAPLLITGGSLAFLAVLAELVRRQPAPFAVTMLLAGGAWVLGNTLWLAGWPLQRAVPWWIGFLVLTIVGERQELSRLVPVPASARRVLTLALAVFVAGLALTLAATDTGMRLAGVGLVLLAVWLLRHDMARRTIREPGLPRFMAASLLVGYLWLGIGGVLALAGGAPVAGPAYDALLHALFLGFVFSMVFGHAPVIFPGIVGVPIPFRRRFYTHLVLLHGALLVRIGGDLLDAPAAVRWGGLLNVGALLLFFGNTISSVRRRSAGPRYTSHTAEPASQTPAAQARCSK
jgi:hypothetical protein